MTAETESRPQYGPSVSKWNYLQNLARWAGIHWEPSNMHSTAENAIERAADLLEQLQALKKSRRRGPRMGPPR